MSEGEEMELNDLSGETPATSVATTESAEGAIDESDPLYGDEEQRTAGDLEAVFEVPVSVSAILGKARMDVSELLKLDQGTVIELDRKVGEAIDIYVNNRLVARGEVVVVEERLGITMTEIIKGGQS